MVNLSILIPTLKKRQHFLDTMLFNLHTQIAELVQNEMIKPEEIEILTELDNGERSTGEKRNKLLSRAIGHYSWFVDDDDDLFPGALYHIFQAMGENPDVICFNGIITTNSQNPLSWEIRLHHPYDEILREGKPFYRRHPNHISPMKREIASQVKFKHVYKGEDFYWAREIKKRGLLKTEVIIERDIYHYKFISSK